MNPALEIILYYKYIPIGDPAKLLTEQRQLCERLALKGRIIIAPEGINGTLEGTKENVSAYCKDLHSRAGFEDVVFKRSVGTGCAFPKLKVKMRSEIVSAQLGEDDVKPYNQTGKKLSADELEKWRHEGKVFVVIDMRNDYEFKIGHFENSIHSGMKNFRDLPQVTAQLKPTLQEKTVITVCTGGVRCEKASGYLISQGFEDVYQLQDGIVTYMEKYPNKGFKGKLYVFDDRISMDFDTQGDHTVVGKCDLCQIPTERYVNCKNSECNAHILMCEGCEEAKNRFCSSACKNKFVPLAM